MKSANNSLGVWGMGRVAVQGWVVLLVLVAGAAGMASRASSEETARPRGLFGNAEQPVKAELIVEHASVQPGGRTRVGVAFDIDAGWHIYAREPGDSGLPTRIGWSGPREVSFGELQWPKPQDFEDPGNIRTFGYTGSLVLMSDLTVAASAREGAGLPLRAEVEWLACKEICLPGGADLELTVPVLPAKPVASKHALHFQQVRE